MKYILFSVLTIFTLSISAQLVTNCQNALVDTVTYVKSVKTTAEDIKSVNNTNDGGAYGYSGYGQKFEAPDTISLKGFCFYGYMDSSIPDTMVASVYKVDASGAPSVLVESVNAPIPALLNYSGALYSDALKVCVEFSTNHMIEGDYMLGVQNLSSSPFFMVSNVDGNAFIDQDSLAYSFYSGVSDPTYNDWYWINVHPWYVNVAGWNFDVIMEPIVEYALNSELALSSDSICYTDSAFVSYDLIGFDDSIFYHKMYNPNYSSYGGANPIITYNYGDGQNNSTGEYLYATGGDYVLSAQNQLSIEGWNINNVSISCSDSIYTGPTISLGMDTTLCNNYTLQLDAGTFDSYDWNTGQTTQTISAGPVVSAGPIVYSVNVVEGNCGATDAITVTFQECVGIEEIASYEVAMYPNPVNSDLTFESSYFTNGKVQIFTSLGKLLMVENILFPIGKLDVSSLESGIYLVSITEGNKIWKQKLQIVR